jgi:hypothetical protein
MYDVFFICYDESNLDKNWKRVLEFHPTATRVKMKGISQAHMMCNTLSKTERFWTIDADNWLLEPLHFDKDCSEDLILFNAIDPIDGYISTVGGVKLWKHNSIINSDMSKGDFCKNATKTMITNPKIFSVHEYNATAFEAWRHSFRHMVKSFSGIITKEVLQDNIARIERHKDLNPYSYRAYMDAKSYVEECDGDFEKINLINDYDWLKLKCPKEMQSPLG